VVILVCVSLRTIAYHCVPNCLTLHSVHFLKPLSSRTEVSDYATFSREVGLTCVESSLPMRTYTEADVDNTLDTPLSPSDGPGMIYSL
jgi:hypothetical protein